jgi:hypothetical protein
VPVIAAAVVALAAALAPGSRTEADPGETAATEPLARP